MSRWTCPGISPTAKVYISSLDGLEDCQTVLWKALKSAAGFIRREIGSRLKMRRTPEFHFISDDSIEYSADIARILYDLDK